MAATMRLAIRVVTVFSVYILLTDLPTLYCNAVELEEKEYVNLSGDFLPETFMTADEIIRSKGYPAESHSVQTEDGYLLTLHRIPHGRAGPTEGDRPPIFLQHTMLLSSAAWVITGPENSLGFLLADAGYDVWLGNSRGNTYSRDHANKTTESFDYWSFSWHEMGKYDFPAVIDYILEVTQRQKLTFIAHSTGANTFYIMCSLRPEYNAKIDAHFSIAPDALLTTTLSAKASLERALRLLGVSLLFINGNEILTNSQGKELLYPSGCLMDPLSPMCQGNFFVLSGFQDNDIDEKTWTMIQAHFPAGTSYKTILHYSQCVLKERYAEMDYGYFNYFKYHQRDPPEYDLSKVDVPVYIHYSQNDDIATKDEVLQLRDTFPQAQGIFEVPWEKFSHLDFLWGRRVRTLFYDGLLEQINTLHGKSGGDKLVTDNTTNGQTSETEDASHDVPQTEPQETQTEPQETQTGPQETQLGPQETQTEPQETQTGPQETQTEPQETQAEPQETQPGPQETQTEPQETQTGPQETQTGPQETQTEPQETQTEPQETQAEPQETQTEPQETQTEQQETQTGPQETQTEPQETQTEPQETPTEPQETQTEPQETPTEPQETQTGPKETQTVPQETQPGPQETQTEPQETQTEQQETQTGPQETQTEPQETQTEPQETPTEPQETQTEPQETPTEPQETQTGPQETQTEPQETQPGPQETQPGPQETQTEPLEPVNAPIETGS